MNYITDDFNELDIYFKDIRQFKRLPLKEENLLWKRLQINPKDLEARSKIIESYLSVPIYMAQKFTRRGVSFSDLIQEGNLALIYAVKMYRPNDGTPFINFAFLVVRHQFYRVLARKSKFIKIPFRIQKETWKALQKNKLTGETKKAYSIFMVESLDARNESNFVDKTEDPTWADAFDTVDIKRHANRIKRELLAYFKKSDLNSTDIKLASLLYGLGGEIEHSFSEAGNIIGWTRQNVSVRNKLIRKKINSFKCQQIVYSN